ncbi:MAG: cellulase family glycosylhydrolase [Rubrivivax sp.]|nr:cellulase family glycosylhydrolase [Rubrivivax sp.]
MIDRRRWLGHALGALATAPMAASTQAVPLRPGAVPGSAWSGPPMLRGLNLSHWFEYERGQGLSRDELRQLRALGFDHVRLPLDPVVCGWRPERAAPLPVMGELRQAIEDALVAGLDLVLDLHLEPADKERIEASSAAQSAVVELWGRLAHNFAAMPSGRLAFELFNEPQFYGAAARHWPGFQARMLEAVRSQAPRHGVLASGHQGASIEGLQKLAPLGDPGVAYVFHYYAPYLFTHQGAHWMDTRWSTAGLHQGVRYPAALQAGLTPQLSQAHPRAAQEMAQYLAQDWGPQRIAGELRQAGDWARRHGAKLVCNEFGVLRAAADPASRYRWITDVRQALEQERIGWTLWDYTDIFGITHESNQPDRRGARRIEQPALQALGLAGATSAHR